MDRRTTTPDSTRNSLQVDENGKTRSDTSLTSPKSKIDVRASFATDVTDKDDLSDPESDTAMTDVTVTRREDDSESDEMYENSEAVSTTDETRSVTSTKTGGRVLSPKDEKKLKEKEEKLRKLELKKKEKEEKKSCKRSKKETRKRTKGIKEERKRRKEKISRR